MSAVEPLRDDGPLARMLPRRVLAVPELLLLAGGALFVALAVAQQLGGSLAGSSATAVVPLPGWAWCLGGLVLAIAGRLGVALPRLTWPQPALLRVVEYGTILALAGAHPWTFAALAMLAYHHYDLVYAGKVGDTAGSGPAHLGGWELRSGVVVAAGALGVATPVVAAMTVALAVVLLVSTAKRWVRRGRYANRSVSTSEQTHIRP